MSNELSQPLKDSIGELSSKAHKIIKKKFPKRTSIIIQFNNGDINIGGIKGGSFKSLDLKPNSKTKKILQKLVNENKMHLINCKEMIDLFYPNNKLKSFNIFYNVRTKQINICKNKIGSEGINKCRLFEEFIL